MSVPSSGLPRVSIGLPVYNGAAFLEAAIESVLAQSFGDFELFISDNHSTDATAAICAGFAARDRRIRYHRQLANIGAKANFRFVFGATTAPLFMWMAADDTCDPDMVARLVAAHAADPEVVLSTADVQFLNGEGTALHIGQLDTIRPDPAGGNWRSKRRLFFRNPTSNICFAIYGLFRRNALASLRYGFGTGLRYEAGVEIPLLAQMACRGKIVAVATVGKHYRLNPDSLYHSERAAMRGRDRLLNFLDIGLALLKVLRDAPLSLVDKLDLYRIVVADLTLGSARLALGSGARALMRRGADG